MRRAVSGFLGVVLHNLARRILARHAGNTGMINPMRSDEIRSSRSVPRIALTCFLTGFLLGCGKPTNTTDNRVSPHGQTTALRNAGRWEPVAANEIDINLRTETSSGRSSSHKFWFTWKPKYFMKLPKWDRRNPNPPVSADQAMAAAVQFRNQLVEQNVFPADSRIESVNLTPYDPEVGDWYWAVQFFVPRASFFQELNLKV
jgi:hypothetical protein